MPSPGHHVGGHGGIAREQHATRREHGFVDAGRDRPCGVAILELEVGSERIHDVRACQEIDPEFLHLLALARAVPQHPEPDVDPPVGQRERPGVPGHEVGLEPDVQLPARRPRHSTAVLPEPVPLAEVSALVQAERLADGAPHPVGGDDVAGVDREAVGDDGQVAAVVDHTLERVAVADVGTPCAGESDECVVELQPRCDRGVLAGGGQWDDHLASAG